MQFEEILGQEHIKSHLKESVRLGRIPHAQLFVGPEGCGNLAMAVAYANSILNSENNVLSNSFFSHPDLHFIFPNTTNDDVKKNPKSSDFLDNWRDFLSKNIYGSLMDWYKILGIDNKQGEIRVDDATEIIKKLSLKSFNGGYKIMIIWMAEKMNISASNKLLKLLEEPTDKTLIILVSENEEDLLQTIKSRCQIINFNPLPEAIIANELVAKHQVDNNLAYKIAHQSQGNYNRALQLLEPDDDDKIFENWFVTWVRTAFRAKGNPSSVNELISWSEQVASLGREKQKQFLNYCISMFRQALLLNYQSEKLVYIEPNVDGFKFEKFSEYVTGENIVEIFKELSEAIYHIERNGNSKIILTDLSIKLTRLIHKK